MKAFILAAGLGTRLKPWTLSHPKALVPVGGVPMLERVIRRLENEGFDYIVVNVHHFASQITDFLRARAWQARIEVSDETDLLLDTGGALVHAAPLLCRDSEPFLIHNVDILSDASPAEPEMRLRAWRNLSNGERRGEAGEWPIELAFSGIHVMNTSLIESMRAEGMPRVFPVMDYYLSHTRQIPVFGYRRDSLDLIDIGKPETLSRANDLFVKS